MLRAKRHIGSTSAWDLKSMIRLFSDIKIYLKFIDERLNNMRRFLFWVVIFIGVILIAAIFIPMMFRSQINDIVKREANDMLTAKFDFADLDISLLRHFPSASIDLKGLSISGVERFEGDTLLTAERLSIVVNAMSLFGDNGLEVKRVVVVHPSLFARKFADGAINWDIMQHPDCIKTESSKSSSLKLAVRNVRVDNADLRYTDDSTGVSFTATPTSLRLRGDFSTDKTIMSAKLRVGGATLISRGITLLNNADVELVADIDADLVKKRFVFSNNTLSLNALKLSLDGGVTLLNSGVNMNIKAICEKILFKDVLSLMPTFYTDNFNNLTATGDIQLSAWAKGVATTNIMPVFELKLEVNNGGFKYSSLPKGVTDINIVAKVSNSGGAMDKTVVDISKLGLKMAGNSLLATLHATNLISDPVFSMSAAGKMNLGTIKEFYPIKDGISLSGTVFVDTKIKRRVSDIEQQNYQNIDATGTFVVEQMGVDMKGLPTVNIRRIAATITPALMTVGECGVTIGKSNISANGQLINYLGYFLNGDKLSGKLYLKSDLFDINELANCSPAVDTATGSEPATSSAAPVVPKNLTLTLNVEFNKVLFGKMVLTNLAGDAAMSDGIIALNSFKMGAFGGSVAASGSYSTAIDSLRPDVRLNVGIDNSSFERSFNELDVVQKLVPLFSKTGGNYSMNMNMSAQLDKTMSIDYPTLNASGEIRSSNIKLQNLQAFDAMAKLLGNDAMRNIEAKDITVKFSIERGRIFTEPFDLNFGGVNVNMSGWTGLDQSIDYTAKVTLPSSATGGLVQTISVGIGGTLPDPKLTLGVEDVQIEKLTTIKR